MYWNQACYFSGTNSSYVTVRNQTSNNITGSFTLEAWVNPDLFNGFSKGIISKGGVLGATKNYAMRLQSSGRFDIYTNGLLRLTSKTSVPLNLWSHVASTYNSATNLFCLYLNGILDTSATLTGSLNPVSNTDSLYIGIAGVNTPFVGMMDEVRIWNRALSSIDIARNFRISLGASSGYYYNGLIMSLTFQRETSSNPFSMQDWSGNANFGNNIGVTNVDLSDQPSTTIAPNLCLDFSFGNDYASCEDHPGLEPTTGITLQAWIYPRSNFDRTLILKGPPTGAGANYGLNIINQKLAAKINGAIYDSQDTIPLNQWSNVAFTYYYDGLRKYYSFYVNGTRVSSGSSLGGSNINVGPDSLYIGGSNILTSFYGYIDEVRISPYVKSQNEINDSLYMPLEYGYPYTNTVSYNLDGYTWCNTGAAPFLYLRNSAGFTNPSVYNAYPVSPMNKGEFNPYYFQKAFYMKPANRRIPNAGTSGSMTNDTLDILLDENITDINVYVGLNHTKNDNLQMSLIAPNGASAVLMFSNSMVANANNVTTVFDDQGTLPIYNNYFVSFSSSIQPYNNINSIFSGMNSKGKWRLAINDATLNDTGRLYVWGIQFNNKSYLPKIISCRSLIQGFYNPSTNLMVRDTLKGYLRSAFSPYPIFDSAKSFFQTNGYGTFTFNNLNIPNNIAFYLQLKHRNSIETWSNNYTYIQFEPLTGQIVYDFTEGAYQAYGNNMISVDNSPVAYAIYGGDQDQDGSVDATDIVNVYNDVSILSSGYVRSDMTGDNFVDASDLILTYNNSVNVVGVIKP
jgi:subtilisin-like proprotein convertase family protein